MKSRIALVGLLLAVAPAARGGPVVPADDGLRIDSGGLGTFVLSYPAIVCEGPDRELLFDLAVDDSADGTARRCQLMWNGTARNSGDRTSWGRLRLDQ